MITKLLNSISAISMMSKKVKIVGTKIARYLIILTILLTILTVIAILIATSI